jgi:long-chain acyl-CoA synthetase
VNLGSGLSHLGVEPGNTSNIGIFATNSVDWVVTEQSCSYYSRVLVPLYNTLGMEALVHILNQAEIAVVICQDSKLEVLCSQVQSCPSVTTVIKIGGALSEEEKALAEKTGVKLYCMEEVEVLGRDNKAEFVLPTHETIATICYTSGTTGRPKGVVLSHGNIIANLAGLYKVIEPQGAPNPDDTHISYLPLAHMLERVVHVCCNITAIQYAWSCMTSHTV